MNLGLVRRRGAEGFPCIPGKVSEKSNLTLVVGGTKSAGKQGVFPVISAFSSLGSLYYYYYYFNFFSLETGIHIAQAGHELIGWPSNCDPFHSSTVVLGSQVCTMTLVSAARGSNPGPCVCQASYRPVELHYPQLLDSLLYPGGSQFMMLSSLVRTPSPLGESDCRSHLGACSQVHTYHYTERMENSERHERDRRKLAFSPCGIQQERHGSGEGAVLSREWGDSWRSWGLSLVFPACLGS